MGRRMIRPGAAPSAPWNDRDALDDYGHTATPDWRDTDWLRGLKTIEIDGIPFNYVDIGSGDRERYFEDGAARLAVRSAWLPGSGGR